MGFAANLYEALSRMARGWIPTGSGSGYNVTSKTDGAPLSTDALKRVLRAAGDKWGVDGNFLVAIADTESAFNPDARNIIGSDAARGGAWGLTQITVRTAQDHGFSGGPTDLLDPYVNADWAGRIMKAGNPSSIQDAGAWWNAGVKHFSDLSEDHQTRTIYIPRLVRKYEAAKNSNDGVA